MLQEGNILLRRLLDEDQQDLARLASNKKIWDNVRDYLPFPYSENDAAAFIQLTRQEKIPMTFAIAWEEQFCGVISLVGRSDIYRKTAEIGYWIGEPFWNKGIATRAVRLITGYGLGQLGFIRIHAGVMEYNLGSMRVLEKNGYVREGIFQKAIFKNNVLLDEHRYAIVR